MKLVVYYGERGQLQLGIKIEDVVANAPITPEQLYQQGLDALAQLDTTPDESTYSMLEETRIRLAPIVPHPGKILCVGLNYAAHARESGAQIPEFPVLFSKFNNTLAAHKEDIPIQADWQRVDYESELAVVIGRTASRINESEALDYVLGYTVANDLSERSLQFRSGQWLLGKTPDKFLPLGPYLVTADEVGDPQNLAIRGWLNGELRQDSHTSDMIFSVAQIIAYTSRYITLQPGDIIITGTPSGVIIGYPEDKRVWMKPGDEYVVEIEKLGRLSNRLVAAKLNQ